MQQQQEELKSKSISRLRRKKTIKRERVSYRRGREGERERKRGCERERGNSERDGRERIENEILEKDTVERVGG